MKYSQPSTSLLLRKLMRKAADSLLPASVLVTHGCRAGNCVALTFDDGPDAFTERYLDTLDRLGVAATFFVLGQACNKRREEVWEIVRRGHEVAIHGYSHRAFPLMSRAELERELQQTVALLPPSKRQRPLVRPPAGKTSLSSLMRCVRAGYTTVLWSIDSNDCRTRNVEEITAWVTPSRVRGGDIVLLHEGQPWTLEALPAIVQSLRQANFSFVTVGELLNRQTLLTSMSGAVYPTAGGAERA